MVPWDCPTCGKAPKNVIGLRGGAHHRYGLGLESRIVSCRSCTLMFADPFPIPVHTSEIYGDPERYFANHDPGGHLDGHRALVREMVKRAPVASPALPDVGSGRGADTTIAAISRLARPGAILYLDVPQEPHLMTHVGNAASRIMGRRTVLNLSPTFTPFHVYGFSQRALETLLVKHGFNIEERTVWASPKVSSGKATKDRLAATVATQINRLANRTGMASNQYVWARRERRVGA